MGRFEMARGPRGKWLGMLAVSLALSGAMLLGQQKDQVLRLSDNEQIDANISAMLAAWQIGDVNLMQKYYADNVSVVSGLYEPPLIGWTSYASAYQQQRRRMRGVQLDRINTYVNVRDNVAWATYQWQLTALVDEKPEGVRGQTTLVFEKKADGWRIVHNHTSLVCPAQPPAPQPAPSVPKKPAKPGT